VGRTARDRLGTAVAVGVNQAADCSMVGGLELGDCGANLGDTADDLMAGNAWIDGGRRAPFVTDLVGIRVAYATEKDFNLNVVFAWIASWDREGNKRRFSIRSSVSLCFILTTKFWAKSCCHDNLAYSILKFYSYFVVPEIFGNLSPNIGSRS
jgi:hypothetical protein